MIRQRKIKSIDYTGHEFKHGVITNILTQDNGDKYVVL